MINQRAFEVGALGDLANPKLFNHPIELKKHDRQWLKTSLYEMMTIRLAEEKIADELISGKIVCPCHLAIGQEAIAVGVAKHLRVTDRAFGTHRSHAHFLAMGGSVYSLFAEILGKATGCSGGMGGSMHLQQRDKGFLGSVPIVAGTVSMAVGAGLAASLDKKSDMDLGVCFFGDGAAEEGSVHESMNLASVMKLPVIFVCENNFFSSHLHILHRQPENNVSRYAESHNLNVEVVDGNDLVVVAEAMDRLAEKARNGGGAGFLEVATYRWRGHVGPSEDNDVGLKRNEDLKLWKERDPVSRLLQSLISENILTEKEFSLEVDRIKESIQMDWVRAEKDPYPEVSKLTELVYGEGVSR